LAFLIATVAVAFAAGPVERFGDLTFDKTKWRVIEHDHGYVVQAVARDDKKVSAFGHIKFSSESCGPADFPERREGYYGRTNIRTIARPGFDIHVAEYDIGCRNWRPPTVEACTTYKNKTYRFSSPVVGCRGGPPAGDGFVEFLSTLSAAD
jgi:hypothetical protein